MNIFVIDDEPIILKGTGFKVQNALPSARIHSFRSASDALKTMGQGILPHVVFMDIQLDELNGIDAAKQMIRIAPRINFIFTTGYTDYMQDAFSLYASGYILKPVTSEKVLDALSHLRYEITETPHQKLTVNTFGGFDVYVGSNRLPFSYAKEKELLAFLIDKRGKFASNQEILYVLWEDSDADNHYSYLAKLKRNLINTLKNVGLSDCIFTRRGGIAINPDCIDCDYYRLLSGDRSAALDYDQNYMPLYSWAEYTNAYIMRLIDQKS